MIMNETWTHDIEFVFDTSSLSNNMVLNQQMLTQYLGDEPKTTKITSMAEFYELTLSNYTKTIWDTE